MKKDEQMSLFGREKQKFSEELFMEYLGTKEPYQLPTKLLEILLSDNKNVFLNKIRNLDIDLSKDFLRDYYQSELAQRKKLSQDYTPDVICEILNQLYQADEVLDVCSGTGSLIITNFKKESMYYCEEISTQVLPILLLNLSIRNLNAEVFEKDVIKNETKNMYILTSSEEFSEIKKCDRFEIKQKKYKKIISNPPYSLKWERKYDDRFEGYELPPKGVADFVFILDIIKRLDENGKAIMILPHGVLFRRSSEGEIRKRLIEQNYIETIVSMPSKMFMNTDIPVCLVVLSKNKKDDKILFIDASKEFEKKGKQNILNDEQLEKLYTTINQRLKTDKYSSLVGVNEIIDNDYNLNIPRYVDTFEKPEPIDLEKVVKEMVEIDKELEEIEKQIIENIMELQGFDDETDYYYKNAVKPWVEKIGVIK